MWYHKTFRVHVKPWQFDFHNNTEKLQILYSRLLCLLQCVSHVIIKNYWMRFVIILVITKTKSNNCFIKHWTKKNGRHVFASSLMGSNSKWANLTWLPVTLSVLDIIIVESAVTTSQALISKIHCMLSANQKRVREFNV